ARRAPPCGPGRLLDRVEDQLHGGECEGAVRLGRIVVVLRLVFGEKGLAARQLLGRRAFPERERALGERTETLNVGVRDDARSAVEHRIDAELVHLRADANADRGQPAEIDHLRIERFDSSAVKSCWSAVTPKVPRILPPALASASLKY